MSLLTETQAHRRPKATVWIVCGYGGLPAEGHRDYRCSLVAKALVERGYRVIWWASSFNHVTKRQRSAADARSDTPDFVVRLVAAPPYASNVSLRRVLSEWRFGRALERCTLQEPKPDSIILMEPARFYGTAVARIAKRAGANLILDIIDLWPELFEMLAPRQLRLLARALLKPLYAHRNWLVRRADAIVGVTRDYVEEVTSSAGFQGPRHVAYWGSHRAHSDWGDIPQPVQEAVANRDGAKIVSYTGSLGNNYDVSALVGAARLLRGRPNIRFVVAGVGPLESIVKSAAKELGPARFAFLGLQEARVIGWLLARSDIGICCYGDGSTVSMPLKAYDYLAAGLPIVNSLDRELGRLVRERGVGLQYRAGDPADLASAISRLCTDDVLRADCAAHAAAVAKEYDAQAQHRDYAEFLIRNKLVPA